MTIEPDSIVRSLPDHLAERARRLNRQPVTEGAEFVLYWMHHAARGHENPALDAAVFLGNRLGLPVLVYQGLAGGHPYNADRHHTFIMEGAREVQQELAHRNIAYAFRLPPAPRTPTPLRELTARAALCITEEFPAPPFAAWTAGLAARSTTAFYAADTACLLPMQAVKGIHERAYRFRDETWSAYEKRIPLRFAPVEPQVAPFRGRLGFENVDLETADIAALCAECCIDHTVGPVAHTPGGSTAGYRRWEQFKDHGLERYHKTRNDPTAAFPSGVSRMSAYLHHGQVSPFTIAREAAASGAAGAGKFLDELLVWRELAHHFCFTRPRPDRIVALPVWARKTLEDHRKDPRRPVFTWEQLARAETGDPLWDAAQRSLLIHGELHNNVRMTWGKAILHWTRSPEEALQMMIDLNHRYALDGSDPNSYGGILWCLGLFDRPFHPPREVIGTLRPRSTRSHAARLDLKTYTEIVSRPSTGRSLSVAVVGAGVSGLVAARTMADHGHRVAVFEKARGAGGRMSTRRQAGLAFDHGAQYFTARDRRFQSSVDSWTAAGTVTRWEGRVRVVNGGRIDQEGRSHRRYVGVPAMSAVARHLAHSLDLRFNTRVGRIRTDGAALVLTAPDGELLGRFDALVVAAPPQQCARMLKGTTSLADRAASVRMLPCWAVMLAFAQPLDLPFDAAFINEAPLDWAARNSSKPGRDAAECWVLHAGPSWSEAHAASAPEKVVQDLMRAFLAATGAAPVEAVFSAAHHWRYARALRPLSEGCLWDPRRRIAVCGDWCMRSRIEGAFLSGAAAAGRILGAAPGWGLPENESAPPRSIKEGGNES